MDERDKEVDRRACLEMTEIGYRTKKGQRHEPGKEASSKAVVPVAVRNAAAAMPPSVDEKVFMAMTQTGDDRTDTDNPR